MGLLDVELGGGAEGSEGSERKNDQTLSKEATPVQQYIYIYIYMYT